MLRNTEYNVALDHVPKTEYYKGSFSYRGRQTVDYILLYFIICTYFSVVVQYLLQFLYGFQSINPLCLEWYSRQNQGQGFLRLETRPISFRLFKHFVGSSGGGFVFHPTHKPTTQVCELEARSRGGSDRRFHSRLVSNKGLCLSPSSLVGWCLSHLREQNSEMLCLVAPIWETQPWYPVLLHLRVDFPRLLPVGPENLSGDGSPHPLSPPPTSRMACPSQRYSSMGISSQAKPKTFSLPGVTRPLIPTSQPGVCGIAGVINNKFIPFPPLCMT